MTWSMEGYTTREDNIRFSYMVSNYEWKKNVGICLYQHFVHLLMHWRGGDESRKVQSVDAFFFYLKTNGAHYCHTNLYVELPWGSQDSLTLHVCIPLILIIELAWRWSRMVKTYIASCYTFTQTQLVCEKDWTAFNANTCYKSTRGCHLCCSFGFPLISTWNYPNILYNPSVVQVKSIHKPQNESAKYF